MMAYTIWGNCNCNKHCKDCRNGVCKRQHTDCCCDEDEDQDENDQDENELTQVMDR